MPRTLAQNAQYINETIKPAIKSAIEAQGVTVPSTDSFLDYADRIGEIEGGGSGYQLKDLPTGAISTVNDAAELPLNALKVSVEAVQSGSGTPSPSNIRPISGWDSGEITVTDDLDNPTQTETTTINFPSTIYGAEWDVVNGPLDNQYNAVDMGDLAWGFFGVFNNHKLFFTETLVGQIAHADNTKIYGSFEIFKMIPNADVNIMGNHEGRVRSVDGRVYVNYDEATDVNDFRTKVTGYKLKYELATPTTINLSPLSIRLLEGTNNNIYADCGEVIEGEYFSGNGGSEMILIDYTTTLYSGTATSLVTADPVTYTATQPCVAYCEWYGTPETNMCPVLNGNNLTDMYALSDNKKSHVFFLQAGDTLAQRTSTDGRSCYFHMTVYGYQR